MMASGTDCDLSLHASMDVASNTNGYMERADDGDLVGSYNRMRLVFDGFTE